MSDVNQQIVAVARSWIGTRFHHQGRVKKTATHKGGVDCLGLLVGIAAELQLPGPAGVVLSAEDEHNYSHQPDCARLRVKLSQLLVPLPHEAITLGNVVLLRIDRHPQHLAIISDNGDGLGLIHAYAPARAVVEHVLDSWWQERIEAAYRIF